MQALRLNEVLTRVVAWHNRHPLARRINLSQVHSVGEVLLPFASAVAPPTTTPAGPAAQALSPRGSTLADVVQARAAARPVAPDLAPQLADGPAVPGLEVHSLLPDPTTLDGPWPEPAPTAAPVGGADADFDPFAPEVGPEATGADADPPAPAADPDADPTADLMGDHGDVPADAPVPAPAPTDFEAALDARLAAASASALEAAHPDETAGTPDALARPVAEPAFIARADADAAGAWPVAAAARPRDVLGRLLLKIRTALTGRQAGMPRLEAAFSRNFIWPLTPRRVATWARRHGQVQPLAPADWPRRQVDQDIALLSRLRQKGLLHTVHLHVLSAAIGVGDRRIRVLMDEQGAIIGPRAYSRPRLAAAAGLVMAVLAGAGWQWQAPGGDHGLAATVAASAAMPASAAASSADPAASSADAALAASAAEAGHAAPALPAPTAAPPTASPAAEHPVATAAVANLASSPVADAEPTGGTAPIGRIRPALSDDDKLAARQQAAQLRNGSAAASTGPGAAPATATADPAEARVYAVVTRPSRQREAAASGLALMLAAGARLPPPAPGHGELMQAQGEWRAAWWPFASLADAERARVLLAGRGLKAEVVEF